MTGWAHIGGMVLFAVIGLIFHIMIKFIKATALPDFQFNIFIRLNWRSWLTGLLWSIAGSYIYHEYTKDTSQLGCNLIGFLMGLSGGLLAKDIINGIISIVSKNVGQRLTSHIKIKKR